MPVNMRWSGQVFLAIKGSCALIVMAVGIFNPVQAQPQQIPRYEVDPNWPKLPLPDRWITGGLGGMCIDGRDHVYILNRQNVVPADLNAASLAPPVIEFDPDGNVVHSWGDPDLLGDRLHDCHVDDDQNVWIVAAGTGHVQKYSSDGSELLLQIGESGVYDSSDGTREGRPLNSDRAQFFLPASVDVDAETGDVYVADGESPGGNQRIAVVDRHGRFLRQWPLHRSQGELDLPRVPHWRAVGQRRPGVRLRPPRGSDPGVRPQGHLHPEHPTPPGRLTHLSRTGTVRRGVRPLCWRSPPIRINASCSC